MEDPQRARAATAALELTRELIRRPSVTPQDAGCQPLLADRLRAVGFHTEHLRFGDVSNLWARLGTSSPLLCFAGHTDVVPTGPPEQWSSPPFTPTERDGMLYGRGSADMKGGLAAMVTACEWWLSEATQPPAGSIAFLITSDEEGPARDGTRRVMEALSARDERIDWCVVGEPSSHLTLGDVVRIGRRGSLSARLRVNGVQGHVAYPDKALNPIHALAPALAELAATRWDDGNAHFPATSLQVSNIRAGTGATNVIPGELEADFNLRYCTESTVASLRERVEAVLTRHGCDYALDWAEPSLPYFTTPGRLLAAVNAAVERETGGTPQANTGGGTSDGRFIAAHGAEVVELGPINATIHQIDEHVRIEDLGTLTAIYRDVLEQLLGPPER
jgi:succinyl-diaminopimelate desuccinylase